MRPLSSVLPMSDIASPCRQWFKGIPGPFLARDGACFLFRSGSQDTSVFRSGKSLKEISIDYRCVITKMDLDSSSFPGDDSLLLQLQNRVSGSVRRTCIPGAHGHKPGGRQSDCSLTLVFTFCKQACNFNTRVKQPPKLPSLNNRLSRRLSP